MLNLDERTKTKAAWVATLLAPLIAVHGVRYLVMDDDRPAAAAAAYSDATMIPITIPETPKPLNAAQAKAAQWLNSRTVALNLKSPMDRPDPVIAPVIPVTPVAAPEAPTAPEQPARLDDTPRNLVLTGILGGAGESPRSLASINHKIYRVGDEVVPGWRVRSIDSKKREVVVAHADGRTVPLTPPSP